MRRSAKIFLVVSMAAAVPAAAQPATVNADAIVVTARRSGIPVWRVRNGPSTLVLVGTIEDVAPGTDWNPGSLAAALRQADQVMFPQAVQLTGGMFGLLRAQGKARKMQSLPRGQRLSAYLPLPQYRRLLGLRDQGYLSADFETRRPLFVASDLIQAAKGERRSAGFFSVSRVDWKTDPQGFVQNAISKYHLRLVPMRRESLNSVLARVASAPPADHVPCLIAATDFLQAGAGVYRARSQAWVARRVPEVIASPAEKAITTCASVMRIGDGPQAVEASLLAVLRQPVTTLAVVELSTLGGAGGILDDLHARGFEVSGPRWK